MSAVRVTHLADVNLLFALLWPRHVHHIAAQTWFASEGYADWATNAITELGALRLLTNDSLTQGAVSASLALTTISQATSHPAHHFWPIDKPVVSTLRGIEAPVTGHRQWTDFFLLREAVRRGGKLVTFDKGIGQIAGKDSRAHLLVLKA